jgi:hypothetical protein
VRRADNLTLKSGGLNLLEPSGPVQASNGIALLLQLVETLHYKPECCDVAGSIPGGFIGIFLGHNPSGHTMALGLTQPLTEMSTRNNCLEIWEPQSPGILRASPDL